MLRCLIYFLSSFFIVPGIFGQSDTIIGPKKGTCLILGGGQIDKHIYQIFLDHAGGQEACIVVIPTATGAHPEKMDSGFVKLKNRFFKNGIPHITVLHTADTTIANSTDFIAPLKKATGVWFTGGRQWRLMDAYADTRALLAFQSILDRGGIIAGTSAGATVQGSFLARGDTKTNTIMMGDHTEGFNFIRNVAIDQHVLARNRQFDLFDILDAHPDLLGIGLDEGTGLLIKGNMAEVLGRSYVLIYDGYRWSAAENTFVEWKPGKKGFYFLKSGDKYNLHQRKKLP